MPPCTQPDTEHDRQDSHGSNKATMGCLAAKACPRGCRSGEESQQPTCPQVRNSRRCTHGDPRARHSSQPSGVRGVTGWTRLRCGSVATVMLAVLLCYACPHARQGRRTGRTGASPPSSTRPSHDLLESKLDRHLPGVHDDQDRLGELLGIDPAARPVGGPLRGELISHLDLFRTERKAGKPDSRPRRRLNRAWSQHATG
jgi:hypothetical protein